MTSNYISTDIADNVVRGSSNDSKNYSTKFQNNMDYINTTGDTFTGDLHMNKNKVTLGEDKLQLTSYLNLGLLKTVLMNSIDDLYVTDPNSVIFIEILKETINVDKSIIVNVDDPTNENDAPTKKYVDSSNTQGNIVISSDFDMKAYEIINLAPGTDSRLAVNKDHLDMAIQGVFITGG